MATRKTSPRRRKTAPAATQSAPKTLGRPRLIEGQSKRPLSVSCFENAGAFLDATAKANNLKSRSDVIQVMLQEWGYDPTATY